MFRLVLGEARPHGDKKIYPALQAVAWTQLGDVSSPSNMENGDDALLGNLIDTLVSVSVLIA